MNSQDHFALFGIRAAGSKDNKTGVTYGGIYYPAHVKNGKVVQARFEANFFLNRRGYTGKDGVKREGNSEVLRLVAWNSPNSKPGKGLADNLAKIVSVGKELSTAVEVNSFMKRLFLNGNLVTDPATGNPVEYNAITFRVKGDINYGQDADATIKREIAAYTGQPSFASRPAMWNVQGHADNDAWKNIVLPARMGAICDGTKANYGYARVILPEGAQLLTPELAAQMNAGAPVQGASPTNAAADLNGGAAAGADNFAL
jgi:hypothetical protein